MVSASFWGQLRNNLIPKKLHRFAIAFVVFALATLVLVPTQTTVHAGAMATQLTITSIAVDDQNWNSKKVFNAGDGAYFVMYVHNPSNFPGSVTLKTTIITGNGTTFLNASRNVIISGNATSGYAWAITFPQSTPGGVYYYHAIAQDSQGSVDSWASFQVVNMTKANRAIAWAKSQLGSRYWNGRCEVFVENAYGTQYKAADAQTAYNWYHTSTNWSPNIGALVWFKPNARNGGFGHVGIYIGQNQFISATYNGVQINNMSSWSNSIAPYEGWGDAPSSWPGR